MKVIIALALMISMLSCNNSKTDTSSTTDSTTSEVGGVQNVNGNVPDTTSMGATPNSGSNTPHVDSTYADTAGKAKQR